MALNKQPGKKSTCTPIVLKGEQVLTIKANQWIEEEEKDGFQYFNKVDVVQYGDITNDYSINLYFDENRYFENEIIAKEIHMALNRQLGKM